MCISAKLKSLHLISYELQCVLVRAYHASTAQGMSSFLFALLHENLNYQNAKKEWHDYD